jgi:hypothetical protein
LGIENALVLQAVVFEVEVTAPFFERLAVFFVVPELG